MMTRPRQSARPRAFTLVELLVVITIIAVLIAILVPSLSRARHQVRSVVCRSNLKQLMGGMFLYVTDNGAFPGTHSVFYFQNLFDVPSWPRISGVTWDGARDNLKDLNYTPAYTKPHHLDPEFVADVPGRGTLFPYLKQERVYRCPSDQPGEADDTPLGGGGNGRLSYSFNGYIGFLPPERLQAFTYVADALDNPLPGGQTTRSFTAGQRVNFSAARFMTMFEEHPNYHMNTAFPEGNFACLDRIATRHGLTTGPAGQQPQGRPGIAYLDGHVDSPLYPAKTEGRELFPEFGQPYFWRKTGPTDRANLAAFLKQLPGPCPW